MTRQHLKQIHSNHRTQLCDLNSSLLQLRLGGDPWKIIVACALRRAYAVPETKEMLGIVISNWPFPAHLVEADQKHLLDVVGHRGMILRRTAETWLSNDWVCDWDLPTVGPYCHAALTLFAGLKHDVHVPGPTILAYHEALEAGWFIEEEA